MKVSFYLSDNDIVAAAVQMKPDINLKKLIGSIPEEITIEDDSISKNLHLDKEQTAAVKKAFAAIVLASAYDVEKEDFPKLKPGDQ